MPLYSWPYADTCRNSCTLLSSQLRLSTPSLVPVGWTGWKQALQCKLLAVLIVLAIWAQSTHWQGQEWKCAVGSKGVRSIFLVHFPFRLAQVNQQHHTFMEWLCTLIKVTVNLAIIAIIMNSPLDLSLTCPIIGPSLQGTSKTISMINITDTLSIFVTRFLRWNPLLIISVWRSPWPSISPFNRMFILL